MNCRQCKEHLYEYLDRELTPAVEQEIRQHIADCPPCGEQFDFEKLFLGLLRARCRAHRSIHRRHSRAPRRPSGRTVPALEVAGV